MTVCTDAAQVRQLGVDGSYALVHIDELAEHMLYRDHLFDIALPRLPKRLDLQVRARVVLAFPLFSFLLFFWKAVVWWQCALCLKTGAELHGRLAALR